MTQVLFCHTLLLGQILNVSCTPDNVFLTYAPVATYKVVCVCVHLRVFTPPG